MEDKIFDWLDQCPVSYDYDKDGEALNVYISIPDEEDA